MNQYQYQDTALWGSRCVLSSPGEVVSRPIFGSYKRIRLLLVDTKCTITFTTYNLHLTQSPLPLQDAH